MPSEFAPLGWKPRVTKQQIKEMEENYKKAWALLKDTTQEEAEEKSILDELFDEELESAFVVTKKIGVYIGRFQPLHKGHENVITQMKEDNDIVVALIGTGWEKSKNPFSFEIVEQFFSEYSDDNFIVQEIQDRESDKEWVENIFWILEQYLEKDADISVYWGDLENDSAIIALKNNMLWEYEEHIAYREIPREIFLIEVHGKELHVSGTKCREAMREWNTDFLKQVLSEHVYNLIIK